MQSTSCSHSEATHALCKNGSIWSERPVFIILWCHTGSDGPWPLLMQSHVMFKKIQILFFGSNLKEICFWSPATGFLRWFVMNWNSLSLFSSCCPVFQFCFCSSKDLISCAHRNSEWLKASTMSDAILQLCSRLDPFISYQCGLLATSY